MTRQSLLSTSHPAPSLEKTASLPPSINTISVDEVFSYGGPLQRRQIEQLRREMKRNGIVELHTSDHVGSSLSLCHGR
jgi:hypothetical protein